MNESKSGAELIAAERQRQIEKKDWTAEHDDTHTGEELAIESANWALEGTLFFYGGDGLCGTHQERMDKPRIRQLAIAGALLAAEIDRLLRLERSQDGSSNPAHIWPDHPTKGLGKDTVV